MENNKGMPKFNSDHQPDEGVSFNDQLRRSNAQEADEPLGHAPFGPLIAAIQKITRPDIKQRDEVHERLIRLCEGQAGHKNSNTDQASSEDK